MSLAYVGNGIKAAGGGGAVTYSYDDSDGNANNQSSYTFSNVNFADAEAGRICLVCIQAHDASGRSLNSVTIDGNSCAIVSGSDIESDRAFSAMAWVVIATGTSLDVVVSWSGQMDECQITSYTVRGSDETIYDSATYSQDGDRGVSFTVDIPADGIAICCEANGQGYSGTWTNDGSTIVSDFNGQVGSGEHISASVPSTGSARATHQIDYDHSQANFGVAGVCATFTPA